MQRIARTEQGEIVCADEALHRVDYMCPECFSTVRLRRGEERVAHFFHKKEQSPCRLRHKDGAHRCVQLWLMRRLGERKCTMERPFVEINRVADVVFHPHKVVFEIQLSPIDEQTARQRTGDYWSIGYHVIWLLHAREFGKKRASCFERGLFAVPHYFIDVDFRTGSVWDELSCVKGRRRLWFSFPPERHQIDTIVTEIHRPPPNKPPAYTLPKNERDLITLRRSLWSCSLCGDFLSIDPPKKRKKQRHPIQRTALFLRLLWYRLIGGS